MIRRERRRETAACAALLSFACLLGGMRRASGEEPPSRPGRIGQWARQLMTRQTDRQWLGVVTLPASDTLKTQLSLGDRLVVQQVVPDSPAARAGVEEHDILQRFGDQQIHKMEDLVSAVRSHKDQTTPLVVLRAGKEVTLQVTPAERPNAELQLDLPEGLGRDVLILRNWLGEDVSTLLDEQPFQFDFVGPGLLADEGEVFHLELEKLPDNLTVTIVKTGDTPAKVTVQRGDESWETTAEKLDVLPDDIRPHVEGMLGTRRPGFVPLPRLRFEGLRMREAPRAPDATRRVPTRIPPPHTPPSPRPPTPPEEPRRSIARPPVEQGPLEELRRSIESLRREIRELREARPTNSEAGDPIPPPA